MGIGNSNLYYAHVYNVSRGERYIYMAPATENPMNPPFAQSLNIQNDLSIQGILKDNPVWLHNEVIVVLYSIPQIPKPFGVVINTDLYQVRYYTIRTSEGERKLKWFDSFTLNDNANNTYRYNDDGFTEVRNRHYFSGKL